MPLSYLSTPPHTPFPSSSLLITMPSFPTMLSNVCTAYSLPPSLLRYILTLSTRHVPAAPRACVKVYHSPMFTHARMSLPKSVALSAVYFINNVPHYLRSLPTPASLSYPLFPRISHIIPAKLLFPINQRLERA